MAKRKKKKKPVRSLKYELYGIALIVLSIIALYRQGSFARSLTYMLRFIVGELDWVIPVIAIYVGLFAVLNRAWPRSWGSRKTSILLVILGILVFKHISFIQLLAADLLPINASFIFGETWSVMANAVSTTNEAEGIMHLPVGGGMLGALLYATLLFLFGQLGTKLIVYALFVMAFILFTGITFVDMSAKGKAWFEQAKKRLGKAIAERFAKRKLTSNQIPAKKIVVADDGDDEEDYDVEQLYRTSGAESSTKAETEKAPKFFDIGWKRKRKKEQVEVDGDESALVNRQAANGSYEAVVEIIEAEPLPYIRDFQDHIAVEEKGIVPAAKAAVQEEEVALDEPFKGLIADEETGTIADTPVKPAKPAKPYQLPTYRLLSKPTGSGKNGELSDYKANARKLEATLESFGVRAKVLEVVRGPSVTRYEIQPDVGVKVSRIVNLTDDIALALAAKDIRMEAPIPGKSAIGIEVPNTEVSIVTLREVMENASFHDADAKLTVALGRDISGQPIIGNLAKMPHVLVAGATGSGKSVCINGIIISVLYKAKPDEVKFLMIDPKMVELNVYNGIPHLLAPVVTDPRRASLALKKVVVEMEKRYELFSKTGTRNIEGYNTLIKERGQTEGGEEVLPLIVVIVDELADLMMVAAGDVEDAITRLAQMARAAGIHLIIATQRPSVDVITGVIKANIPSRIAFGVSSQVDSRTILDTGGAEKLLGRGDMLYLPVGASKPVRIQGAFLSDQEVEKVVAFVRDQEKAEYREDLVPEVEEQAEAELNFEDELYDQAVQMVVEAKQASVSFLQRRMRIGYTRAARLIDAMEAKGVVGPYEGSKPREVLISLEQFMHNQQHNAASS